MKNRQLTPKERDILFKPLLKKVLLLLEQVSKKDKKLLWALRRKLGKEIIYLERKKPMQRKALKQQKRIEQNGKCAQCKEVLPQSGAVLDRFSAMPGYTKKNTRLLCSKCDTQIQKMRKYR
jgi:ribosomal protein L44E